MEPGTQLLHYEILGKLGAGGMGEVYLAEDSRLKRQVAIKVLPAALASDPERLARLEREAQVLASLEHPNIAAVHGLEEADSVRFLVMQFVSGVTLEDRISEGPIPTGQAWPIALQIARGLEAAHENGVVHRDLKPANVMLDPDDNVKLLDFGLAKPTSSTDKSVELTASPTVLEATQLGVIMGTASYMSPEQARGRTVDKRSDIWSWGCVVYEMLTGQRLFVGESVSDIIAAVLRQEIDLGKLPTDTPALLRRLTQRALVREPADRLRDIGDARIALSTADDEPAARAASEGRSGTPVAAAALVAGLALGGLLVWALSRPAPLPLLQLDLAPPGLQTGALVPPALSPDGEKVLYRAEDRLWVRDLSQPTGSVIAEAADVAIPFWSADSEMVVYMHEGSLWRQDLAGGAPVEVASFPTAASGGGGVWDPAGRLLIAQGSTEIFAMPARGGELTPLFRPDPDREEGHFHAATVLPDGTLAYVVHRPDATADTIGVSRDGERRNILTLEGDYLAHLSYSPEGALVFSRVGPGGDGIWVVPFELGSLTASGDPIMLLPQSATPSLSVDGKTLLYDPQVRGSLVQGRGALVLLGDLTSGVDSSVETVNRLTGYENLMLQPGGQRFSPDGRRLAFSVREEGASDLWVLDVERGARLRLTDDAAFESRPVWSTNGEWIYFSRNDLDVARVRSDGSGSVENLGPGLAAAVVHGTDRLIVQRRGDTPGNGFELWFLDAEPDGDSEPFRAGRNVYGTADVSRDGDLVAYASLDTAEGEIMVEDLANGQRWAVSDGGGRSPRWGPDGNLYYVAPPRVITRVSVSRTEQGLPEFGSPAPVLELTPTFSDRDITPVQTPDGLRFLTVELEDIVGGGHLVVALNADRLIREALGR